MILTARTLPLATTSFVGRDDLLAEVARLLGTGPLVTLVGPGGAGKTRLAVEVARRVVARFPGGVVLVDLTPVSAPDRVAAEVAVALGVREGAGDVVGMLVEQVGDRALLLVLDTCEHVVDLLAPLVYRLVGTCPRLRVLCTSREPLGLVAESLVPVGPLDRADAVGLLVDRARAADPTFPPPDGGLLRAVCARLDDLPLAIELAAPWVRVVPASRLPIVAARYDLAPATRRDLPARQRTMRATVEWSHELLAVPERVLLRRLAVFAGTVDLAAIAPVCADPPADVDPAPTRTSRTGPARAGLARAGLAQTGPAQTGPARADAARADPAWIEPAWIDG